MAVIYGRRRVGKMTLISEFARDKRALIFTALEKAMDRMPLKAGSAGFQGASHDVSFTDTCTLAIAMMRC